MRQGYWQLTVQDSFAAAHALRYYQGKCESLHGHNFNVEICVQGQKLEESVEILLDFSILKKELKEILLLFDHKCLNDLPEFSKQNPSSENLARYIYKSLNPKLEKYMVQLLWVKVSETPNQSACYME